MIVKKKNDFVHLKNYKMLITLEAGMIQIQKMAKDTKQEREGWPSGVQM